MWNNFLNCLKKAVAGPSTNTSAPLTSFNSSTRVSPVGAATDIVSAMLQTPQATKRISENPEMSEGALDLSALCAKSINGRLVLAYYKKYFELDAHHRDLLADVCLCDFLKGDPNRQFTDQDERKIGQSTLDLFPKEIKEVWIGDDNISREKSTGRGKLCNRWYNLRRKMSKVGLIPSCGRKSVAAQPNASAPSNVSEDVTPEIAELLVFLENFKTPPNQVLDAWKKTHSARRTYLIDDKVAVNTYMDRFIALKHSDAPLLLNMDFNFLFPNAELKLFLEWPVISAFILSKLPKRDKDEIEEALTNECQKLRTLLALTRLMPIVTAVKKGKNVWRPSRKEAAQGLIEQVKTVGDIKTVLSKRQQEKYDSFGLKLGPQAVVVVSEDDIILGSYVVINMMVYEVDCPRKAVDTVFKAMHALDTPYHAECKREWLFLQCAVYGFETPHDKSAMDIKTRLLVNEYKEFKG